MILPIVLEYIDNGSLRDFLQNKKNIVSVQVQLGVLKDVAQGLLFLHHSNPQVVHGNLKGTNVLITHDFKAKLTDFGLHAECGTGEVLSPFWAAPECLQGDVRSAQSDIYSFGVLIYEVFARTDPYGDEDRTEVLQAVIDPEINKRPAVPRGCPVNVSMLMSDCLNGDPQCRPGCEEVNGRVMRLSTEHQTNPSADLHMETSIVSMEIAGFASWASARNPSQSILLLEAGK